MKQTVYAVVSYTLHAKLVSDWLNIKSAHYTYMDYETAKRRLIMLRERFPEVKFSIATLEIEE